MSLTPKEIGDVTFKLGDLMALYGKKLDQVQSRFWIGALSEKPVGMILRALDDYPKTGKYAPKPVDILEIVDQLRAHQRGRETPAEEQGTRTPEIAQAWITYLRFAHGFEVAGQGNAPGMPLDQALEIVNREAARLGQPDAILPDHRIAEFWDSAAARPKTWRETA